MLWMKMPLIVLCATLSLNERSCTPEQIDSFCVLYRKVIVEKGDGQIKASVGVKKRLLANEQLYIAECKK